LHPFGRENEGLSMFNTSSNFDYLPLTTCLESSTFLKKSTTFSSSDLYSALSLSSKTNEEYILDDLDHHEINSPTSPYYDKGDQRNTAKHHLSVQSANTTNMDQVLFHRAKSIFIFQEPKK
jgi:hypothetical protein